MYFNTKCIKEYRNELFGIGAIGVLMVHSCKEVQYPIYLNKIFSYGGIGVYIFVFLSGIGLYNSLKKCEGNTKKSIFYKKRIKRVIIPYFIIAGIWYFIKYVLLTFKPIMIIYEISTLSFWIEHKGAWYIAMIIPIYIIYPFFYSWAENDNKYRNIKCIVVICLIFISANFVNFFNKELFNHLQQIFSSIIVFVIGHLVGEKIFEEKDFSSKLIISCFLFMPLKSFIPILKYNNVIASLSYAVFGIALTVLFAFILKTLNSKTINRIFNFLGQISLELYLTNIFLIQASTYFSINYIFIVLLGVLFSKICLELEKILIKKIKFLSIKDN